MARKPAEKGASPKPRSRPTGTPDTRQSAAETKLFSQMQQLFAAAMKPDFPKKSKPQEKRRGK